MDLNAPGFHSQGAPAPVNMPRRRRGYDYDYEDRTFIRLPPPTPRTQTYYRLIWYPASTAHSTKAKIKPRSSKLTSILLRQLNAERSMPAQPQPEVILNAGPPQIIVTGPPVPPKPAAPKPAFEGPATFSAPMSHVRADGTVNWTGLPKPSKYVVEYKDGNVVHSIFDPAIRRGTFLDELFDVLMQLLWIPIMIVGQLADSGYYLTFAIRPLLVLVILAFNVWTGQPLFADNFAFHHWSALTGYDVDVTRGNAVNDWEEYWPFSNTPAGRAQKARMVANQAQQLQQAQNDQQAQQAPKAKQGQKRKK